MTLGVVSFFWLSGEVQMCTEFIEHVSRKQGRDLTTEGLWALSRNSARLSGCIHISLNCSFVTLSTNPPLVPNFMRAPLSR